MILVIDDFSSIAENPNENSPHELVFQMFHDSILFYTIDF
jgi:hypothetical protein